VAPATRTSARWLRTSWRRRSSSTSIWSSFVTASTSRRRTGRSWRSTSSGDPSRPMSPVRTRKEVRDERQRKQWSDAEGGGAVGEDQRQGRLIPDRPARRRQSSGDGEPGAEVWRWPQPPPVLRRSSRSTPGCGRAAIGAFRRCGGSRREGPDASEATRGAPLELPGAWAETARCRPSGSAQCRPWRYAGVGAVRKAGRVLQFWKRRRPPRGLFRLKAPPVLGHYLADKGDA